MFVTSHLTTSAWLKMGQKLIYLNMSLCQLLEINHDSGMGRDPRAPSPLVGPEIPQSLAPQGGGVRKLFLTFSSETQKALWYSSLGILFKLLLLCHRIFWNFFSGGGDTKMNSKIRGYMTPNFFLQKIFSQFWKRCFILLGWPSAQIWLIQTNWWPPPHNKWWKTSQNQAFLDFHSGPPKNVLFAKNCNVETPRIISMWE